MLRILLSIRLAEKKWKQADLARVTGIRPNTINDLYNEFTDKVNLRQLEAICKALDCNLCDLIMEEEKIPPDVLARMSKKPMERRPSKRKTRK